jgi:hypothetical protein
LTPSSTSIPTDAFSSMLKMPTFFPTSIFQKGWQQMSSANQAMSKDKFYQQIIFILNTLG